jgi:hypothetical protein
MEGHRHDEVGSRQDGIAVLRQQRSQAAGHGSTSIVFERVHDRAQRTIVIANRPAMTDLMLRLPAPRTRIGRSGDDAPRSERVSADVAERRSEWADAVPAALTDRAAGRLVQGLVTRGAEWSQKKGEQSVNGSACDVILPPKVGGDTRIQDARVVHCCIRSFRFMRKILERKHLWHILCDLYPLCIAP